MSNLKKLTLLHSNDMHGDFLAEKVDEKLVGGVSMLSGYINKVRSEEENVIYAIAGDMFRGSIIDSEYHGLSTIQIMNLLAPDIVTLGNHEIDYGIAHLLFLEKCAQFPIINANLYIKLNHIRLFEPCRVISIDGMKILFIGILTEMVLNECKKDELIGTFITLEDAVKEIGRICNTYNSIDIDFTVLLTHIGFEEDKKLARMLDPTWGVDVIIGGHSHTFLDKPCVVNGIPIVQAGTGTDQIGRFDILVDTDNNRIDSYTWTPVPINAENCSKNPEIEDMILNYKNTTDEKYGVILTTFVRELTHPSRYMETELGNLFADLLKESLGMDIFLLASGSIRCPKLGHVVTKGDFMAAFPYDDQVNITYWTGAQLKHGILHMLRDQAFFGDHTEFYQFSSGLSVEYDMKTHSLIKIDFNGEPVRDDRIYSVGLQDYHLRNLKDSFDLEIEEIDRNQKHRAVATSSAQILEEMLTLGQNKDARIEGRIVLHLTDSAIQALLESGR
ncbi:MAG: bifunctional metallophosphatase/5'-nucleotidase [Butyrivibrio sp.]|nr:bifunctional UDP-sugar hydrolase/5'-nucleotidase [Butyrivibrio sp.]MCR4635752.1 bifunctional metallophosphatase/5'-nucleotidase [Butyrivibrio sp.]